MTAAKAVVTLVSTPRKWNQGKAWTLTAPRPGAVSTPRKWNQGKATSRAGRSRLVVSTPRKWNQGKAPCFSSSGTGSSLHASEVESRQSRLGVDHVRPRESPRLGSGIKAKPGEPRASPPAPVSTPRKWNQGKASNPCSVREPQSPRLGSGIKAKRCVDVHAAGD